jgi:transcription-repair coupling factor (superfamily II helicase)
MILRLVPNARITFAHGQMEGEQLEKRMMKFVEGEYDVLVSTNIIESGLDIPNANTIIINRAHLTGLSDLHQMRGRVGRSNRKAYCYLLTPPVANLPADARKRLNTGYEAYHQVLDEAVQELKETEFKDLFLGEGTGGTSQQRLQHAAGALNSGPKDTQIETDLPVLIPDTYVNNVSERLQLYAKLDRAQRPEELAKLVASMTDRFGPLPEQVQVLVDVVKLRWQAGKLGFEKVTLKRDTLRAYLPAGAGHEAYFQGEQFGRILNFVQTHPRSARMKDQKDKLQVTIDGIKGVKRAQELLVELGAEEAVAA